MAYVCFVFFLIKQTLCCNDMIKTFIQFFFCGNIYIKFSHVITDASFLDLHLSISDGFLRQKFMINEIILILIMYIFHF